jgi:hypothetical protein
VFVGVAVFVGVPVRVGVGVRVFEGVRVGVTVRVLVGVRVGVVVRVLVDVRLGVEVFVQLGVLVGVLVAVVVRVRVGVGVNPVAAASSPGPATLVARTDGSSPKKRSAAQHKAIKLSWPLTLDAPTQIELRRTWRQQEWRPTRWPARDRTSVLLGHWIVASECPSRTKNARCGSHASTSASTDGR